MDAEERDPEPVVPASRPGRISYFLQAFGRAVVDAGTALWRVVVGNLFVVPAAFLAFVLLFMLPQTANLLWQLPALSGMTLSEMILSTMLTAYLPFLLILYTLLWLAIEPSDDEPEGTGLVARAGRVVHRIGRRLETPLRWSATRRSRRISRPGWTLVAVAAILALATRFFDENLPTWWRVYGSTYATMIGLTGVWLFCCPPGGELGYKTRITGRALTIFIATMLAGQLLWMLTDELPGLFSPRVYSIWAIIQIAFLLLAVARVVDSCHLRSKQSGAGWNVRGLVVLGVSFWLLAMPSQKIGRFWELTPRPADHNETNGGRSESNVAPSMQSSPARGEAPLSAATHKSPTLPMGESIDDIWFGSMEHAIARTDPGKPLIFVSASGGGARAAMFTALVFEALRHTPLYPGLPDAPTGSTADERDRIKDLKKRTLADQIVLISGVSGGSLASAYYVSQNYPHLRVRRGRTISLDDQAPKDAPMIDPVRNTWRNAFPNDLYSRMYARSLLMLDETRLGRGRSVSSWAGARFDEAVERVAFECERLATGRNTMRNVKVESEPIAPWVINSAFVDDMSTDFMAPLLRGMLNPGLERGVSVTRFWESEFRWRDVEDTDLHRMMRKDPRELEVFHNGAPLLLLNTCDVAQGSRLVLGFPPIPAGVIRDPLAKPTSHLAYALADRGDLYYHVSLAEAVRLSANFPFGFEVGKLPLSKGDDTVLALDGGIVDNSGIDSIVYLIQGLSRLAEGYRRTWENYATEYERTTKDPARQRELVKEMDDLTCKSLQGRAYRLLVALAKRRIMLVQIDSGTKEIQTSASGFSQLLAGLSPVVFRPFQALNNASYTNAEQAIEQYDEAMKILEPLPAPHCPCERDSHAVRFEPPTMVAPAPMAPAKVVPAPQAPAKVAPAAPQGPVLKPPRVIVRPFREPPDPPPSVMRVRLTCNQSANIMTAWTLGPEDKAQVLVQFLIEWQHQRSVLETAYGIQSELVDQTADWPGMISPLPNAPEATTDYPAFVRGQRLVDRARSEFYQTLFAPGRSATFIPQASPTMDEFAKDDIQKYDHILEKRSKRPAIPPPPPPPPPQHAATAPAEPAFEAAVLVPKPSIPIPGVRTK